MSKKQKQTYYQCPKCKSTDEVVGLQLTGKSKHPYLVRHICAHCNTHMVKHVIDVSTNPKLKKLMKNSIRVK